MQHRIVESRAYQLYQACNHCNWSSPSPFHQLAELRVRFCFFSCRALYSIFNVNGNERNDSGLSLDLQCWRARFFSYGGGNTTLNYFPNSIGHGLNHGESKWNITSDATILPSFKFYIDQLWHESLLRLVLFPLIFLPLYSFRPKKDFDIPEWLNVCQKKSRFHDYKHFENEKLFGKRKASTSPQNILSYYIC